jgi:DNA/RNA-binding domain of Phe-tRNA-synthetase-like protein
MSDEIVIETDPALAGVAIAAVHALGCSPGPSPPALAAALDAAIAQARGRADTDVVTGPVRDLLRHGRYKPTGRGKPASEYLLAAAREGTFPRVSALVDINNLVSLETLLPASVIDRARAGARRFLVRRGRDGESYVFNGAGQTIELRDLLLVATLPDDRPIANPVKDAMATKVPVDADAGPREILAVLYAPAALASMLPGAAARFASLLRDHAGATDARVLSSGGTELRPRSERRDPGP